MRPPGSGAFRISLAENYGNPGARLAKAEENAG